MKTLGTIVNHIIDLEGGYSNHEWDLGGETKYGITLITARKHGYMGPMIDLPKMTAKMIYIKEYWTDSGIAKVNGFSQLIAIKLFDIAVNAGVGRAGKWFQRLLNLLTNYKLKVDGQIGPKTLTALQSFMIRRRHQDGEKTFVKGLTSIQGSHYINITEKREGNRNFIFGWLRHRI